MSASVIVLFGGNGNEHRVSVASAQNVAGSLDAATLWFWNRDGGVEEVSRNDLLDFPRPFENEFTPQALVSQPSLEHALDALRADGSGRALFLALHGGSGEDGTVQTLLEARGLAFTGSSATASRLAFDKERARDAVRARGILVAEAVVVTADSASQEALGHLFETYERVVLKPVSDGSSHGMRIIGSERELDRAIVAIRAADKPYLAEAFVAGRELTVGVVETPHRGPTALPCSEVKLDAGHTFDFEGKYLGRGSLEITPADLPDETAATAQALAVTAHTSLGCEGYSRTDVILGKDGPVFLETNTLPGLTHASFIPQQLRASGISMTSFLDDQLAIAVRRAERLQL